MLISGHFHQQKAEKFPLPETGGRWTEKPEESIQGEQGVPRCVEGRREGTGWSLTQGQLTRAGVLFPKGKYRGSLKNKRDGRLGKGKTREQQLNMRREEFQPNKSYAFPLIGKTGTGRFP